MSKQKIIRQVIRVEKEMSVDVAMDIYSTIEDTVGIRNTKFFHDDKDAESYVGQVTGEEEYFDTQINEDGFLEMNLDQLYPGNFEFGEVEIVNSNVTKFKVESLNPYELEVLLHEYPDYEIQWKGLEKVLVLKDEVSNGDESH